MYSIKKILIITYYWPPSGGAGVQRWTKLSKYLRRNNLLPYILTVNENSASYMQTDKSMEKDILPDMPVYKTKSFEPINIYASLVGRKNVPDAGFSNTNTNKLSQKIISFIRSNLFIPDPRKGWNKYAYKKAVEIIKKEDIKYVITSSPPHSTQLIGLKLKKNFDIKWIADFRDPWTDIYYYKFLRNSVLSDSVNRKYEKQVLLNSDIVLTVSEALKQLFAQKDPGINKDKIHIIPNGYDNDDFENIMKMRNEKFTICYTGTMADNYEPAVFFKILKKVMTFNPATIIQLQIIGKITEKIKNEILNEGINLEFIPVVPHNEIVVYQARADLLLLVIPNVENAQGILTGKIFEYLATGNSILCIGPEDGDAAQIINVCEAGKTFSRNNEIGIEKFLNEILNQYMTNTPNSGNRKEVEKYSRKCQAEEIIRIINSTQQ